MQDIFLSSITAIPENLNSKILWCSKFFKIFQKGEFAILKKIHRHGRKTRKIFDVVVIYISGKKKKRKKRELCRYIIHTEHQIVYRSSAGFQQKQMQNINNGQQQKNMRIKKNRKENPFSET